MCLTRLRKKNRNGITPVDCVTWNFLPVTNLLMMGFLNHLES